MHERKKFHSEGSEPVALITVDCLCVKPVSVLYYGEVGAEGCAEGKTGVVAVGTGAEVDSEVGIPGLFS